MSEEKVMEDEASKNHALVANEEEVPTEYALMAKSSSSSDNEVYNDSFCSKSCMKNTENLNTKISKLNEELSNCETDLYNYKIGLSQVKARLVEFKENEIKYYEKIRVLERDIEIKDNKIKYLRNELEEVKKEKESIDFKIKNFENASKDLDRLLRSQKLDKDMKGVGFNEYCVIPPPSAQVYSPLKKDLSSMGLPEFVDDTVTDYTRPTPSINVSKSVSKEQEERWKHNNPSFFEQGGSSAHSNVKRPFERKSAAKNKVWSPTVRPKIPTLGSKVPTAKPTVAADMGNKGKAVKASAPSVDESMLWHRRLGHLNFKTMNKLVRSNLVKGLPSKSFENDHSYVACLKGKQHKASFVTDDFSRFTWSFFLKSKDETSRILRNFITEIENLKDLNVKIIRSDNRGEFRNKEMDEFCSRKCIKREFSNARTPQQNGKFDAKGDEGYFVRYSLSSKAFREHLLLTFQEQQEVNEDKEVSKSSGNSNPTASTKVSTNDSFELASSSTVETEVPTVNTHVPIYSLYVPLVTSNVPRIIFRGGSSFPEPLSLGNAMSFEKRLEDFFRDTSNAISLNEVEADLSNLETAIQVSPIITLIIHKDHPKSQIICPIDTLVQTRQKTKNVDEQSFIATIHQKTNPDLLQYCLFLCFLSQEEPNKIVDALKDPSWVEAMQQELLKLKIQNVWVLVDSLSRVRPIRTKWVLKNKKDERGIVIRNKARLVVKGHTQKEGIDYEEVFAPIARIEAIRLFLAYASYMGFTLYQMNVKSAFLYGTINEKIYVMQPLGYQDPEFPHRVYKVEKAIEFEALMHDKFQMSAMGECFGYKISC
nr:hypothetical protein [Tanacetum cinerariifolium]